MILRHPRRLRGTTPSPSAAGHSLHQRRVDRNNPIHRPLHQHRLRPRNHLLVMVVAAPEKTQYPAFISPSSSPASTSVAYPSEISGTSTPTVIELAAGRSDRASTVRPVVELPRRRERSGPASPSESTFAAGVPVQHPRDRRLRKPQVRGQRRQRHRPPPPRLACALRFFVHLTSFALSPKTHPLDSRSVQRAFSTAAQTFA